MTELPTVDVPADEDGTGENKPKDTLISEFCVKACEAAITDSPYDTSDVCDLAHKVLVIMHPDITHDVEDHLGCLHYTDSSQDLFNEYFDEVEGALYKIGLELSTNHQWVIKENPVEWTTYS